MGRYEGVRGVVRHDEGVGSVIGSYEEVRGVVKELGVLRDAMRK